MCCIFTCLGWMIDLVQRAWVFAMSCCISSAVCCAVATASMSGVALGYNYSLAEYIELKETNVSVYLKRGVFDDEVVDEMDWRRGGGGPPAVARRSFEQSTEPSSVPDFPFGYRKANDEGMFATTQINEPNNLYGVDPDHHRFEGSLMKLTARPTANVAGKDPGVADSQLAKVITAYPQNSMEQLKAIQGLMNRRVLEDPSLQTGTAGLLYSYPIVVTGSIPMGELAMTTVSSGMSEEMKIIQKLLKDRKMSAMKFESMKRTKTPEPKADLTGLVPETYPGFGGPARRMGDEGPTAAAGDPVAKLLEFSQQQMANDRSKWYQPKQVEPTSDNMFMTTRPKGPVTLSYSTTHKKISVEDVWSQNNFRRAMLNAVGKKSEKEKDDNEKEVQNIINEPQRDYDEEDVKGFPVRKKRKKRNKRSEKEHSISLNKKSKKENKPFAGTGLFNKIMTALMKFKLVYGPEDAISNVLHEARSSDSLLKPTGETSTDIVTSTYVNIGASSTRDFLSKLIKSTIVS